MEIHVDKLSSRVSNSPVEAYFNILKNITLRGRRNIRPAEYVRESFQYIQTKEKEIENTYLHNTVHCVC